jgi:hypothetical protein
MYRVSGLGCVECGGVCPQAKGLGSIDLSTLSWEDYLIAGIALMSVYAVAAPDSRLFNPKPKRRKRARKISGGTGFSLGTAFGIVLVGGIAYLAYQGSAA